MNDPHVLHLVALWIEGDLEAGEMLRVDSHLALCGSCRAEAEALRLSQSWLKAAPPGPFEESDHGGGRSQGTGIR